MRVTYMSRSPLSVRLVEPNVALANTWPAVMTPPAPSGAIAALRRGVGLVASEPGTCAQSKVIGVEAEAEAGPLDARSSKLKRTTEETMAGRRDVLKLRRTRVRAQRPCVAVSVGRVTCCEWHSAVAAGRSVVDSDRRCHRHWDSGGTNERSWEARADGGSDLTEAAHGRARGGEVGC